VNTMTKRAAAAALVLGMTSSAAYAGKVFDAGKDITNANCAFNTVCGPNSGAGDDYAAQLFTLGNKTTILSASYVLINQGYDLPTEANWKILAADGVGGLPGAVLASGTSSLLAETAHLGDIFGMSADIQYFGFNGVTLASGSYYFAVQAVSPSQGNYLAAGTLDGGAAEFYQGNWQATYQTFPSVAVALYNNVAMVPVPEPTTYAMLLGGLAMLGVAVRRRRGDAV